MAYQIAAHNGSEKAIPKKSILGCTAEVQSSIGLSRDGCCMRVWLMTARPRVVTKLASARQIDRGGLALRAAGHRHREMPDALVRPRPP